MKVNKIKTKTIVDQIMEEFKRLFVKNELKPEDKIPSEVQLAEMFGVGRSTIREAIKTLNYIGVLETKAAKGTFVKENFNISTQALSWSILLAKKELRDIIDLRRIIELRSLDLILESNGGESSSYRIIIKKLNACLDKIKTAVEGKSVEELVRADYGFHYAIVEASGNGVYKSIYRTLESYLFEQMKKTYGSNGMSTVVESHSEILKALELHDRDTIFKYFDYHYLTTSKELGL